MNLFGVTESVATIAASSHLSGHSRQRNGFESIVAPAILQHLGQVLRRF